MTGPGTDDVSDPVTDPQTWAALVGTDVTARGPEGSAVWRCTGCTAPTASGGWLGWSVTFEAPGLVDQGLVGIDLPGARTSDVLVVPATRTGQHTHLVATFTAAALTTTKDADG